MLPPITTLGMESDSIMLWQGPQKLLMMPFSHSTWMEHSSTRKLKLGCLKLSKLTMTNLRSGHWASKIWWSTYQNQHSNQESRLFTEREDSISLKCGKLILVSQWLWTPHFSRKFAKNALNLETFQTQWMFKFNFSDLTHSIWRTTTLT